MISTLNAFYCSSDFYTPFTGVSVCSLLENNKHIEKINIFLSPQGISPQNIDKMRKLVEKEYSRKLVLVDSSSLDDELDEMGLPKWHGSYATYYKMFITQLITEPLDSVVFIEGDTIITGSFEELINTDMGDLPIGMVRDIINNLVDRSSLNIPKKQQYYMGGLCFYNLKKWSEMNCEGKIKKHLLEKRKNYKMADQDILNVVLGSNVFPLPLKYNVENNPRFYSPSQIYKIFEQNEQTYYGPKEIEQAVNGGAIMNHCLGGMCKRPWEEGNHHPLDKLYHFYLQKTPWANMKDIPSKTPVYNKVQWILYKTLPRAFYIPIMRASLKKFLKGA